MKILAIAIALTLILSFIAQAGQNPAVKVALHAEAYAKRRTCEDVVITDCSQIVSTLDLSPDYSYDILTVFFDVTGVTACEYGLTWAAGLSYSAAFSGCGDLLIGDILWPGDGVAVSWTLCQMGWSIIPGWVYIDVLPEQPLVICPIPNPTTDFIGVTDCDFDPDAPICFFCAGLHGAIGDDPCEPTAAEASTWGGIKSMFK